MSGTQKGYLLIADISGYTQYLSESELEHAQQTLSALLEILVEHTRPPLVLSRLAGDAVVSYGLGDHFYRGQAFVEMIEDTYAAFRRAIDQMVLNNSCRCNACANIGSLDLKFFVHYGTFAIQHIGDHDELVGSDVNLIHRLLKNQVTEMTGLRGYTLYTEAAIHQLGIEEISASMTAHSETYEYLGEVRVWVQDMGPAWQQKRAARPVRIPEGQVLARMEIEIALPPEVVWNYLIQLEFRKTLLGADRQDTQHRAHGRVAEGSVYVCYHGKEVVPQMVVDWQPFEGMVTQDTMPIPIPEVTVLNETRLERSERGTRLRLAISRARGRMVGRVISNWMLGRMGAEVQARMEAFRAQIEGDFGS